MEFVQIYIFEKIKYRLNVAQLKAITCLNIALKTRHDEWKYEIAE